MGRHRSRQSMVVIEFIGGPRDGEVLAGDLDSPASLELAAVYKQLRGGKVGEVIWLPTEYALRSLQQFQASQADALTLMGVRFPGHVYQVFARRANSRRLHLRLSHCGACE